MVKIFAESFEPMFKNLTEVNKSTKKLEKKFKKLYSENENQQKIVPVEFDSEYSEDETRPDFGALPKIAKPSALMGESLGSLLMSQKSLRIEQGNS